MLDDVGWLNKAEQDAPRAAAEYQANAGEATADLAAAGAPTEQTPAPATAGMTYAPTGHGSHRGNGTGEH